MIDKTIGQRIRMRREQLHITQTQLADLTGFADKTAISKIENGKTDLNQTKIKAFSEALHTTPAYLMGWIDTPTPTGTQEERLLVYFRALSDAQKDAVMAMLKTMGE